MIVNRNEQHYIKPTSPFFKIVDNMCFCSKNIYNLANYFIRQKYINDKTFISRFDMQAIMKTQDCYRELGSNTGQVTIQMLNSAWQGFFSATKDYTKNPSKYYAKPKIPKYLDKNGKYVVGLTNNKFKIINGYIYFSWKKLYCMNKYFKTNIPSTAKLMQIRFVPKGVGYYMEVCYQIDIPEPNDVIERVASIDLGVSNFITMVNNIGEKPIAIKGGVLKSINQYYNKNKAQLQSILMTTNKAHWSKQLQFLTDKRYRKIKYFMHCASRYVIDWCKENNIDTLIVGRNKNWKQENKGMQNFTYIPFELFETMIWYKCENNGIKFILLNESYTSGTSFLDNEKPCKEKYNKDRRVFRGLFISNNGIKINADVNGAYQIMRKAIPNAFAEGIEGVYLHPLVVQMNNHKKVFSL